MALTHRLAQVGCPDPETYGEYISGVVTNGGGVDAISELLSGLLPAGTDVAHVAAELVSLYGAPVPQETLEPPPSALSPPPPPPPDVVVPNNNEPLGGFDELGDIDIDVDDDAFTGDLAFLLEDDEEERRAAEEEEFFVQQAELYDKAELVEALLAERPGCASVVWSSEAVCSVLWDAAGDVHAAAASIADAFAAASACKPCRHWLQGQCYKRDCAFSHDVGDVTCRYFLMQQGCAMIDNGCPFKHTVTVTARAPATATASDVPLGASALLGEAAAFPSLPGAKSATATSSYGRSEYAKAVQRPPAWPPTAFPSSSSSSGSKRGSASSQLAGSASVLPADWVDSGTSVAADYAKLREEARSLAIARNKFLEEATQAYMGGAKGLAKSLSAQGRALNVQMKACHLQAAKDIFSRRNTSQSILAKGRIDLHGLHVAEAVATLEEILPALPPGKITIVTGSGHHTAGPQRGQARLLPAVQNFLGQQGYKFWVVKDDNGHVGGCGVSL
jgi:DNA-nicking Smr family endonuclease